MTTSELGALRSPNFQFLNSVDPLLVELGARAEHYALDDPNTSMLKVRQLGELLAQLVAARYGIATTSGTRRKEQRALIEELFRARAFPGHIASLFHEIRKEGNVANHEIRGDQGRAITLLRFARKNAVWFYRAFVDKNAKLGPFVPPMAKPDASDEARHEIERLQAQYEDAIAQLRSLEDQYADEAELRKLAEEERELAYRDLQAAMELVEEETAKLNEKIQLYEQELAQQAADSRPSKTERSEMSETGDEVAAEELSEADTREIIDMQLRAAGWSVDSNVLRHGNGVRPEKGKNLAIAEWPTRSGPADYVLFCGLMPVAAVEGKKRNIDVAGKIDQAKRYSRDFTVDDTMTDPGGVWQELYQLPFVFSANGRGYLKQLRTKSGIWFYDARRRENLSRPLCGWYSPEGLKKLLDLNIDSATDSLTQESSDYLPLYPYQHEAISSVENAISKGRREMMVAMATGTGKTRLAICLCYRLIKSQRFRRILFLVDRTSLGIQAAESFKEVKLERQRPFTEVYDVKELGDLRPDGDTKLQMATIQGMMNRILSSDSPPPVDQYDCIIVDECHRGYTLDQEMSDKEMQFRNEADYISKYMRVLEYFDATKIGLTATPALHTLMLFGGDERKPIYQYSYRQAVIDNYLVDHEPPFRADTDKIRDGIHFTRGQDLPLLKTRTNEIELSHAEDDVSFDVEDFNARVLSDGFNESICKGLAEEIDPNAPGKTLIFCVNDAHADSIVFLLKQEFLKRYPDVTDETVKKITGASERPIELIRRYKNEKFPSVAVTVDLLTTGVNVPEIDKLVFLRRVRSRILYEQMIGRATRKCPDLYGPRKSKDHFVIYDCVDLYPGLLPHTAMKPVVARPSLTFAQLATELQTIDDKFVDEVKIQFLGKLSRKLARATETQGQKVTTLAGVEIDSLIADLEEMSPQKLGGWLAYRPQLISYLDATPFGDEPKLPIDETPDHFHAWGRGYGVAERPEDYLESFRKYIEDNLGELVALRIVTQRPGDLTRKQLRDLRLALDTAGFTEARLRVAFREQKNQEIAASIIGYIRNVMLDTPLIDYQSRVDHAMGLILESRDWTSDQLKWLKRIGKQLREETIVDRESLNAGEFRRQGGFNRINQEFDGQLDTVLREIANTMWNAA